MQNYIELSKNLPYVSIDSIAAVIPVSMVQINPVNLPKDGSGRVKSIVLLKNGQALASIFTAETVVDHIVNPREKKPRKKKE